MSCKVKGCVEPARAENMCYKHFATGGEVIKKEFEVQWSLRHNGEWINRLPFPETLFFDGPDHSFYLPSGIKFSDLTVFHGKKTRVTIEVIE